MSKQNTHDSDPKVVYSPSWHRTQLMAANNYVGADTFPNLGTWLDRDAQLGDILIVRDTSEPVCIIIVGVVSADNFRMQPQGNYNKSFSNMVLSGAKMQFTLKKPMNTIFEDDFDLAIERIESIQGDIAVGSAPCKHFIIQDEKGSKCFRMSFPLFEKKNKFNKALARKDSTNSYPIGNDFKDELEEIVNAKKYYLRPSLRVHRYDASAVHLKDFESELPRTLVEVTFSLKHYTFSPAKGSVTNTITSSMHQIIILQDALPDVISLFDTEMRKGPIHLRQDSPKKRKNYTDTSDQVVAAQVFGPAPVRSRDLSPFVEGSSTQPMRQFSMAPTERTIESKDGANDFDNDAQSVNDASKNKRARVD